MELSIVSTLYKSAPYLREFYERARREAEKLTPDFELILVNDGSPDESLAMALALVQADPRVKAIDLSRNFGHHKAMMTGLAYAKGELVFLIDSDLEEQPELLLQFHRVMKAGAADVVYGVQQSRGGTWFRRASGALFYWLFNLLSDIQVPKNICTVRLMSKRYVRNLVACRESELTIAGLWQFTGFSQEAMPVDKKFKPTTSYGLRKKIAHAAFAITAFSRKPLVYIACLGAIILLVATTFMAYLIVLALFLGKPPSGYTSTLVSIWFLGGLILFSLGVVAIYLSVVFIETKGRPYTVIRHVHDRSESDPAQPAA